MHLCILMPDVSLQKNDALIIPSVTFYQFITYINNIYRDHAEEMVNFVGGKNKKNSYTSSFLMREIDIQNILCTQQKNRCFTVTHVVNMKFCKKKIAQETKK